MWMGVGTKPVRQDFKSIIWSRGWCKIVWWHSLSPIPISFLQSNLSSTLCWYLPSVRSWDIGNWRFVDKQSAIQSTYSSPFNIRASSQNIAFPSRWLTISSSKFLNIACLREGQIHASKFPQNIEAIVDHVIFPRLPEQKCNIWATKASTCQYI